MDPDATLAEIAKKLGNGSPSGAGEDERRLWDHYEAGYHWEVEVSHPSAGSSSSGCCGEIQKTK
jgi:hypothetical protein